MSEEFQNTIFFIDAFPQDTNRFYQNHSGQNIFQNYVQYDTNSDPKHVFFFRKFQSFKESNPCVANFNLCVILLLL